MDEPLPRLASCLMIGALTCLLGSAGSFSEGVHSLHDWTMAAAPLVVAVGLLGLAARCHGRAACRGQIPDVRRRSDLSG